MAIALVAAVLFVPEQPKPARRTSVFAPLKALKHRGLLTMSITALLYNWAFFIGINNVLTTQAVMVISPRPTRRGGGRASAPWGWRPPRAPAPTTRR